MKTLLIICLSTLLSSCYSQDAKKEQPNQRVTLLEQRMDSLTNRGNSTPWLSDQCKAITKRGKACKRKGKYKGYCWQHRG